MGVVVTAHHARAARRERQLALCLGTTRVRRQRGERAPDVRPVQLSNGITVQFESKSRAAPLRPPGRGAGGGGPRAPGGPPGGPPLPRPLARGAAPGRGRVPPRPPRAAPRAPPGRWFARRDAAVVHHRSPTPGDPRP